MSGKKIQKKTETEDEMSDEWQSDEDEDIMPEYNKIEENMELEDDHDQIEYEFYDSNPNQYHSIKSLINNLLDGNSYNSSNLADIITEQVELGTMIGIGEEGEDIYQLKEKQILGFATLLPLYQMQQTSQSVQQICQFIMNKLPKDSGILEYLGRKNVGLLINERLINISPQVVPVLFQQLREDVKWANEQEEYKDKHTYTHVITITQCFKEQTSYVPQNNQNSKLKTNADPFAKYIYSKFEDYLFLQNCQAYYMFNGQMAKSQSGLQFIDQQNLQQVTKVIILMHIDQFYQNIEKIPLQLE